MPLPLQPNAIAADITPYIVPSPRGVDMAIKQLQANFASNLDWLDKSFARAIKASYVGPDGSKTFVYPSMFVTETNDYLNMIGLDNFDAYSFFVAKDPLTPFDYTERRNNTYQQDLDLIFWLNLNAIDPNRGDDFLPELRQDVINEIKNTTFFERPNGTVSGVELLNVYDSDPLNVFQGYTIDLARGQQLYRPFGGMRFELRVVYIDNCT